MPGWAFVLWRMVRIPSGIFMPCGAFLTFLLHDACKTYSLSNQVQLCCGPNPKTHININKKTPHGCLFYLWRMVRDSNPRWSCPHNGFQDRRIRPLCQPSETVSVGLSTYGFGRFVTITERRVLYIIFCVLQTQKLMRPQKTLSPIIIVPLSIPRMSRNQSGHRAHEIIHKSHEISHTPCP